MKELPPQPRGMPVGQVLLLLILVTFVTFMASRSGPDDSPIWKELAQERENLNSISLAEGIDDVKLLIRQALSRVQVEPNFLNPEMIPIIRSRVSPQGDVVLLTAGYSYREGLLNWIVNAERAGVKNWIICCFDNEIDTWLRERGSQCHIIIPKTHLVNQEPEVIKNKHCRGQQGFTVKIDRSRCLRSVCPEYYSTNCLGVQYTDSTRECTKCVGNPASEFVSALPKEGTDIVVYKAAGRIWHLRWLAAMDIMDLDINVALVDLDAIVFQNFFPYIRSLNADVVAQKGYGPAKAASVWGHSVCMGFSYWRVGTKKRHDLIKMVEKVLRRSGDDQNAVAVAFLIEGVRFPRMLTETDRAPVIGRSPSNYSLALLPFSTIPRKCTEPINRNTTIVAHCPFGGKPDQKKSKIWNIGGWLLTNNFEDYNGTTTFDQYLANVTNSTTKRCYDSGGSCSMP
eukprot:TRINITY_DN21032_c0_g1_i1.p1 TRINITY_DN21032_c0_g1~~TRINITY_DN21032_c0_g1_i1.p1  ORF type:complete len:473 (+),score=56.88 TRINITY_DN21032_c0_g1_i1:57-1421(+)